MAVVLGLDAAWTAHEPTGVALVAETPSGWQCLVVAPSYQSFLDFAKGHAIDWSARPVGSVPDAAALLSAARSIAGQTVDVIAVDMPVSTRPISARRPADNAVSLEFGGRWCSAHSPSAIRPGPLGAELSRSFRSLGYPIATTRTALGTRSRLLEIYPHPALLALLDRPKRVPYKVSRAGRYWPKLTRQERVESLLQEFHAIDAALQNVFGTVPLSLPSSSDSVGVRGLKKYEDALDALVSAWVGKLYLEARAVALGDSEAAIWCPTIVVHGKQG